MAFLSLRGVRKSHFTADGEHPVLRDLDLEVEQGEFVAIVGPSGSGKTTLVSLIAGLIDPDAGEIVLDGEPIRGPGPDRGVVFQSYSLLAWMTVFDNVHLAVESVSLELAPAERQAKTERLLRLVNLGDAMHKRPHELSGGMRQRVAVARGLAMDPKVLLLDEPFSALDALTRATLQQELVRLWMRERKTVVMVTNDVEEAILLAGRIFPLTAGPGATMGRSIPVDMPHPRSSRVANREPAYHEARRRVVDFLVQQRRSSLAGARPKAVPA
ncbi:MAG: ABC transporter ATP-binding protein [Thermodesulfobacteriota bacterium]